jgi:peptidoglycan glycosyltransferase
MIDRSLRRVLAFLLVGFAVLLVQVSRVQVLQAEELRNNPDNGRSILRDFNQPRGQIVTGDGVVVAESVEVFGSVFDYQRTYPESDLYAHTAGYYSFNFGASGVERAYNDWLSGRAAAQRLTGLNALLGGAGEPGTIVLSIDHTLQAKAKELLDGRRGSVVMIEPDSGAVVVSYSSPSFDPNRLADHDGEAAEAASAELFAAPGNPRRPAAFAENFFPGSAFKVITAAAAFESDGFDAAEVDLAAATEYFAPLATRPIRNSGGAACGGTIDEMIAASCNTGFARLAAEFIGPDRMISTAESFGFNKPPELDIGGGVESDFPTDFGERLRDPEGENLVGVYGDSPVLAQSALGQNSVSASTLQMAMVAAAVANGGEVIAPHVVREIRRADGSTVETIDAEVVRRAITPATAIALQRAMRAAVAQGTASGLQLRGIEVGAKTGTAQVSQDAAGAHAWVIGFAGKPGFAPDIAFAVHVQADPNRPNQSGSRSAVPIARSLLEGMVDLS